MNVELQQAQKFVRPALLIFAGVYCAIAILHLFVLEAPLRWFMFALAILSVIVAVAFLVLRERKWIRANPDVILKLLVLLMTVNTYTHLYLKGDVIHAINILFVLIPAGFVFYRPVAFVGAIAGLYLLWGGFLVLHDFPGEWLHYSISLVIGTFVSALLYRLRQVMINDATVRAEMLEVLQARRSEIERRDGHLRNLINDIPVAVMVRGQDTGVQLINQMGREALGLEVDEEGVIDVAHQPWQLLNDEMEPVAESELPVNRILRGERLERELLCIRANGRLHWMLGNGFPMRDPETDEPIAVFAFIDISERIAAENRLRESEQLNQHVLSAIGDGIIAVDSQEVVTQMNPVAVTLTGVPVEEAKGLPLDQVLKLADDKSSEVGGHQTLNGTHGMELQVDVKSSTLRGDKGEIIGRVLDIRDRTRQLREEEERQRLDRIKSVGDLAGGIAHDFNNLLVGVFGNIALARSTTREDTVRDYLEDASKALKRATFLTNQLLTFATGSEPVRERIDVENLIDEVINFSMSGSGNRVRVDAQPGILLSADPALMSQVLNSLIVNARQATGEQGQIVVSAAIAEAAVLPSSLAAGDYVCLTVSDNGPGIPREIMRRIFDPYFSTNAGRFGLGLATAHSIVVKHGGAIVASNLDTGGACFSVFLPVDKVEPLVPDNETTETPESMKILIMDDEEMVRDTMSGMLKFLGHVAHGVENGEAALDAFNQANEAGESFDVVILDMTVAGGMGGAETAKQLLELDPDARLIVASGYSSGAEKAEYQKLGFTAVLNKPFTMEKLREVLQEAW